MSEINKGLPDREDVLNNEAALLQGLIEAGGFREDESLRRKIDIRRGGRALFSFTVRPIDEEEERVCLDKVTPKYPNPAGRKLPKIEGKSDWVKFRSWKIYMATIDEDRARIWDNPRFRNQFNVLSGPDMVDVVLRSGDKDAVCSVIDEISGAGDPDGVEAREDAPTLEEYAKN